MHLTRRAGQPLPRRNRRELVSECLRYGRNILVAGEEQTLSRGSLARVGDSAQSPDAMSLLVCTATVMSLAAW